MMKHILTVLAIHIATTATIAQTPGTVDAPHYLNATTPIDTTAEASPTTCESPLYRKKIVVIGDSYVRNHRGRIEDTWHYRVAQKYQMTYLNFGRNGNCIAFDRPRWGVAMLHRLGEVPTDADYVVVIAGHNDADYIALGDIDTTDWTAERRREASDSLTRCFRDSLAAFADSLVRRFPSARVAFVTPWNVGREGFDVVLDALRDVLGERSIPVYDAAHQSGIYVRDARFRRLYFQGPNDTAHLNPAGHALVQNKMERFLLGL